MISPTIADALIWETLPMNISTAIITDMVTGNDPLTVLEIKKVLAFVAQMEVGVTYPQEDMILFFKFLNKFYSIKSTNPKDYQDKSFISDRNREKAIQLTEEQPLFVPYADRVLNDGSINFMERISAGLISPVIKELGGNMGLVSLADYVFTERGFKKFPGVIPDILYKNLKGLKLYRGFKNSEEIRQFMGGEFYVSNWTAGSGVYFTTNKDYATAYAPSEDLILECVINENDCKVADNEILMEAMTIDTQKGEYNLFYDVGIYGAVKGIDVINRMEFGYLTKLILNRGKLIISENEKIKFS